MVIFDSLLRFDAAYGIVRGGKVAKAKGLRQCPRGLTSTLPMNHHTRNDKDGYQADEIEEDMMRADLVFVSRLRRHGLNSARRLERCFVAAAGPKSGRCSFLADYLLPRNDDVGRLAVSKTIRARIYNSSRRAPRQRPPRRMLP
jgi:hypothetical protein